MSQKSSHQVTVSLNDEEGMQAFRRLEEARAEIRQYLPEDFDPDKELEEARAELLMRYQTENTSTGTIKKDAVYINL
ncbi:MAG: hypothetical protein K2L07_05120 [Lachnospiraceae bacterium]|nr:hypothetical protein [Lachnospiraceae bacterium]